MTRSPIDRLREDILEHGIFAWDLETTSKTGNRNDVLKPEKAAITHIALAGKHFAYCFGDGPEAKQFLVELLSNPNLVGLVHNAPYDYQVSHFDGLIDIDDIKCKLVDTLVLAWLVNEEEDHGLKYLVKKYCGIKMTTYDEVSITSKEALELSAIEGRLAALEKGLTTWLSEKPKRPWPTFEVGKLHSVTMLSRALRETYPDWTAKERKAEAERLLQDPEEIRTYQEFIISEKALAEPRIVKIKAAMDKDMRVYATADAANLHKLFRKLMALLKKDETTHAIKVEMAVRYETIRMRICGMPINIDKLQKTGDDLKVVIDRLRAKAFDLAKQEFNPNSPKQLQELIFNTLSIKPPVDRVVTHLGKKYYIPKFTKSALKNCPEWFENKEKLISLDISNIDEYPEEIKKYLATDVAVLERLSHPIGQAILDFRTAEKLQGTYIEGNLEKLREREDGRLHGTFNSVGTDTGRFSSSGPNLQNIPSRAKSGAYDEDIQQLGPSLRDLFVTPGPDELAPEGYDMFVADHSQVELRLAAHFTKDPNLQRAYTENVIHEGIVFYVADIHQQTAELTNTSRKLAKNTNFGLLYGMGPPKFARQNKLFVEGTYEYDFALAQQLSNKFFMAYRKLRSYAQRMSKAYREQGVSDFTTIGKRKRHFSPTNTKLTGGGIINAKIQGSGADILKYNIYIICKYLYPKYPGLRLIGQVHDEIIFVIPKRFSKEVGLLIKYVMEYPWYHLSVPVLASAKVCPTWAAKDDDTIPEIGKFYAEIEGQPQLFDETNWDQYLALDAEGKVTRKCTVAQLDNDQIDFCRSIIPEDMPKLPETRGPKLLSREEVLKRRQMSH